GKVTVLHPDKIGRRQRGATEACFLHVAGKRRGSRLPRLPGGEQLRFFLTSFAPRCILGNIIYLKSDSGASSWK
ncbi:MAG: hypothetical protein OXB88_02820, partial [Bacteriovoracales bacterium]|nr:hypothetical protein [Bacteriovoracales bacterium]